MRLYILSLCSERGPCNSEGRGRGCALQCGLLVNYGSRAAARLAWAGVGASGSGTGRSGHRPRRWRHEVWDESEHQPGVWSIPRIPSSHGCLPVCVYLQEQEEEMCERYNVCMFIKACIQHVCMFYILAVWILHPGFKTGQHQCRTQQELSVMISELRVSMADKSLMKLLSLNRQISLAHLYKWLFNDFDTQPIWYLVDLFNAVKHSVLKCVLPKTSLKYVIFKKWNNKLLLLLRRKNLSLKLELDLIRDLSKQKTEKHPYA